VRFVRPTALGQRTGQQEEVHDRAAVEINALTDSDYTTGRAWTLVSSSSLRRYRAPSSGADGEGRSYIGWYLFGFFLFIIALPASLLIKDKRTRVDPPVYGLRVPPPPAQKRCPDCAEIILVDARVCKHCGYRFTPAPTPGS